MAAVRMVAVLALLATGGADYQHHDHHLHKAPPRRGETNLSNLKSVFVNHEYREDKRLLQDVALNPFFLYKMFEIRKKCFFSKT